MFDNSECSTVGCEVSAGHGSDVPALSVPRSVQAIKKPCPLGIAGQPQKPQHLPQIVVSSRDADPRK